jgi:hypothetical protein
MGVVGIVLVAAVLLLPTGLEQGLSTSPKVNAVKPISASDKLSEPEPQRLERNITVGSEPPGAEILADGIQVGITPVVITIGPDGSTPNLEANLYGHQNKSFRIPTEVDKRFVVTLVPLPTGTVRISAKPWAKVSFRGRSEGETPVIIEKVPVGKHTFILSYDPLGVERRVTMDVTEKTNTVSVDMREK